MARKKMIAPAPPKPETVESILQRLLEYTTIDFEREHSAAFAQDIREDTEVVIPESDEPAIATVLCHAVEYALEKYMKRILDDFDSIIEAHEEEAPPPWAENLARDLEEVLHSESSKNTWLNVRDILSETLDGLKKVG